MVRTLSIQIDELSAGIDILAQGARPGVFIRGSDVICHLSQGFSPNSPDGVVGYAFDAFGQLNVTLAPSDALTGWEFGFIQLARATSVEFSYAGKTSNEGSIAIKMHLPPALRQNVLLDSDKSFSPWTRGAPRWSDSAPSAPPCYRRVISPTGDHPALKAKLTLTNDKRKTQNFILKIVDDRDFWSMFCAKDHFGRLTYLAHFKFGVRYDVTFIWVKGYPRVFLNNSYFRPPVVGKGAPLDLVVLPHLGLVANPNGPLFNDEIRQAIRRSIVGGKPPNRADNPQWFSDVPIFFYT